MARKETAQTTCVLYDPADGNVVLVHTEVRFGSSRPAGRKAAEAEARSVLSRRKQHRPDLRARTSPRMQSNPVSHTACRAVAYCGAIRSSSPPWPSSSLPSRADFR